MTAIANKVFDEALSLPSDERVSLVEKLLTSLNLPIQAEIDRLWMEESERRVSKLSEVTWNSFLGTKYSRRFVGSTRIEQNNRV